MDNSYGLIAVQEANLKILKEVDRICTKYNISYMLDAGTLIGAVRDGGFIAWDDDADIVMTRENYVAFKKVAADELIEGLTLLMPDELRDGTAFFDFTPRIIYKASRRRRDDEETEYYEGRLNHLWVDIFILDSIPEGIIGAQCDRLIQKLIYLMSMGKRYKLDYSKYSMMHKIMISIVSRFGKLFSVKSLFRWQTYWAEKFGQIKSSQVFYSNYQPDYMHIILDKRWTTETMKITFEDTSFTISKHYKDILALVYTNYMELPPEEMRVPTHGSTEIEIYG